MTAPKRAPRGTDALNYEADIHAWAQDQARFLRAGAWSRLDLEHLADEIADVGRSERHALTGALCVILLHLLKWDHQPARRSRSWVTSIRSQRSVVEERLEDSASLECLTEPSNLVEGDQAGREVREGLVDVCASLVADGQSTESVEPGVGAFHDPTVTTEFLAALDAPTRDARDDPPRPALLAAGSGIVGLVSVQLVRTASRSSAPTAPHRRDGVEGGRHHDGVVPVGPAQAEAERRAARVGDEMALRARLAPVRRVRAGGSPPFLAGTDALSRQARLQSISPAACRRSSNT